MKKTNLKRAAKNGSKSIVEAIKTNAEGGSCHEISDPSERLIATIGACNNEPKFYPTDPGSQAVGTTYDSSDFDEQAQLVINTAFEVAESNSPKDLVQIAHWARKELKMRTIPQVLIAVAAHCNKTKEFVREYTPKVVNRADELKQVFVAERSLFGTEHSLPNSLKRGLSDAFTNFEEYDFLKYEGKHRPFFSDVLKMIDRRKDYPLPDSLDYYLKTGEVKNKGDIPIIAARKELTKLEVFDSKAKELAKQSKATWEVLVSQFGGTKEVWEHLIDSKLLGYMATMRNMRNILQAGISKEHLIMVANKIKNGAIHSKQLPFRFLAAKMILTKECAMCPGVKTLTNALDEAVQILTENGDEIPGLTLIAVDTSASMTNTISEKSVMTHVDAASILAGILHTNSEKGSVCGIFGSQWAAYDSKLDTMSPLQISSQIVQDIGRVGHGTDLAQVFQWALKNRKKFDRIIILSDMQTFGTRYYWSSQSTNDLWTKYRQDVNADAKLHSVDLAGHGTSIAEQGDTSVNLISGYSEKLLDTILRFEGIDPETGTQDEEKQEFTLEYVRKNY